MSYSKSMLRAQHHALPENYRCSLDVFRCFSEFSTANGQSLKLTQGETSKTEEKKADVGLDDIHKDEHAKNTESSTSERQALDENQRNFSFTSFLLYHREKSMQASSIPKSINFIRGNLAMLSVNVTCHNLSHEADLDNQIHSFFSKEVPPISSSSSSLCHDIDHREYNKLPAQKLPSIPFSKPSQRINIKKES
uniref:Uncharacterized protein n=1 Tax=Solanum lycopersicum TaxID=4081 RepID=A0A3Q7EA69_SOLLC